MKLDIVNIENPDVYEIIIGQGNFTIKTIEDMYDILISSVPDIKFGVAMNEAKPQLARIEGNDEKLKQLAGNAAVQIGAGHVFVIYLKNAFPIHCLNAIKNMATVVNIYVATSNPLQILTTSTDLGKAVLGVIDGKKITKIENQQERAERKALLAKLGYTMEK